MEGGDLYLLACWLMTTMGVVACLTLVYGPTAPYGRYSRGGWGPMIPPRVAWVVQEAPSFLVPLGLLLWGGAWGGLPWHNKLLAGCFLLHYLHRAFIYPFRIKAGKQTPLVVFLLALLFCLYNGALQGYYFASLAPTDPPPPVRLWGGIAIWALGMAANVHSDGILRSLRRPGDGKGEYRIPRGGLFEWVSGANFAGEMLEWVGWAAAVGSPSAWAFALFTCCNVGPRAWQHHRWYLQKFPRYPKGRRAVIPFVL